MPGGVLSIDVFLSYASQDRDRVRPLVDALKAEGWSVWWDRELVPGSSFETRIEEAIGRARCVVVVWTAAALASEWVRAEAHEGLRRGVLVPLLLDRVRLPLAFRHKDAAQLFDWGGDPAHPEYRRLVTGIRQVLAGAASGPSADIAADESALPPRRRPARSLVAGVLVALLALAGGWWWTRHRAAPLPDLPANSVAVLRFVNLGSPADDYRSVGLSLELLNLLTRIRELHVPSQVSSFATEHDVSQVRQRLAVRYFVEGSYRQEPHGIAVEAQLVDTATGYRLWSESIRGGEDALVDAPLAIARRVVESLNVELSSESLGQLQSAPTSNLQALDHYLRGNEWLRAFADPETLASAETEFADAARLDPAFAMPYGGLCRVHLIRYQRSRDVEQFSEAERDCHRTLSLNALQVDPYKALGDLYLASGRLDEAESQYRIAQRLSPRDAEAVIGLADLAAQRDQEVEAERGYRQAIALEPHYWRTHNSLARFLFARARFGEAASAYERLTKLDPSHRDAWGGLGSARYMQGDFEGALAAWQKALALAPGALEYSNVGTANFFLGRFAEASRMYQRAVELEPKDHRFWGHLGDARELLGEHDAATAAYETAADLARRNLSVNAADVETRVQLAGYDAGLGREDLARRALADTLASAHDDPYLYYDAAVAYTRLREPDAALDALAVAVQGGYPRHLVAADPQFEPLRAVERFARIVR